MGKSNEAAADHSADEQIRKSATLAAKRYDPKISHVIRLLQERDPANKLHAYTFEHLVQLCTGLEKLSGNARLWSPECPDKPTVLKQHLAFTLFAPAGRADRAYQAVLELSRQDLLCKGVRASTYKKIIKSLVRFPQQKSDRLVRAMSGWDDIYKTLGDCILTPKPEGSNTALPHMHEWLIANVSGFNRKAAAHFLRNSGAEHYHDPAGVPIIDIHIYKALTALNFASSSYALAEQSMLALSQLVHIPPVLLDAALWCSYSGNWGNAGMDFSNFQEQ